MSENIFSSKRKWIAFALLLFLVFLIYSNTFNASWHMDDYPNITLNYRLHIKDFSYDTIFGTFFANPEAHKYNKLYRPIPCLTFALNWYFGREDVTGYHMVNITIHFLTAFFLYLTVLTIFKTPNLKGRYRGSEEFTALLAATLWTVNPIQTQAVTYIVQRMATMAAMFYILSIYFYIKGRIDSSSHYRVLFFTACIISYVFALGSKENAAILPLALLLLEVVFFQDPSLPETLKRTFWSAIGSGIFIFLTGTLFFLKGNFLSFMNGYGVRPFTLPERLLTEPRVLIFYLSQIFYPIPDRLSMSHDVRISTSLFEPWTTLPAILLVIFLIGFGISQIKKRPVLAFAILFFFLNHLIESTVIPLELLFEHRNYLPSLFLFFPVATGLHRLLDYVGKRQCFLNLISVSLVILIIIAMGIGTYSRNKTWATEKSLWQDVLAKAPGLARPYQVLAGYYEKKGRFDIALNLYSKSLSLPDQRLRQSKGLAYNNMGTIYLKNGDFEKAINFYRKALEIRPAHDRYRHNMILALVNAQKWQEASETADLLLAEYSFNVSYINLKSFILIKQKRPEEAISYLRRALRMAPHDRNVAVNLGVALSLTGKHKQAEWILRRTLENNPESITTLMCLIENSLRAEDVHGLDQYIEKLLTVFNVEDIKHFLRDLARGKINVPVSQELLAPAIAAKLKEKSGEITGLP